MTNFGYIALHRKIEDSFVYQDSGLLHLWIHCLIKASHIDRTIMFDGQSIDIKRGQFITGRKSLAKTLKTSEQKVRSRIALLQKHNKITQKSTNRYSIISVIKYDYYQTDRNKITSRQPADNQQTTTNNNGNNGKQLLGEEKSSQLSEKDMGWKNKQSDNDDGLPVIDMDTQEPERDIEDELKKKVTALIEWAETIRNKKFADRPTQRKFVYELRKLEISPTDIKITYSELLHSDYWKNQDRLPDFKTVYSSLKNKKHD